MKVCSKCMVEKELGSFYESVYSSDGRRSECIDCTLSNSSKWRDKVRKEGVSRQKEMESKMTPVKEAVEFAKKAVEKKPTKDSHNLKMGLDFLQNKYGGKK